MPVGEGGFLSAPKYKIELYRKWKTGEIERSRYKLAIKRCRHTIREARKHSEIM